MSLQKTPLRVTGDIKKVRRQAAKQIREKKLKKNTEDLDSLGLVQVDTSGISNPPAAFDKPTWGCQTRTQTRTRKKQTIQEATGTPAPSTPPMSRPSGLCNMEHHDPQRPIPEDTGTPAPSAPPTPRPSGLRNAEHPQRSIPEDTGTSHEATHPPAPSAPPIPRLSVLYYPGHPQMPPQPFYPQLGMYQPLAAFSGTPHHLGTMLQPNPAPSTLPTPGPSGLHNMEHCDPQRPIPKDTGTPAPSAPPTPGPSGLRNAEHPQRSIPEDTGTPHEATHPPAPSAPPIPGLSGLYYPGHPQMPPQPFIHSWGCTNLWLHFQGPHTTRALCCS